MPGPDRRRDGGRRGRARLCADAADPRAAHPAREGDVEHHDEPDAARARRARVPLVAGPQGLRRWGRPAWASPPTRRNSLADSAGVCGSANVQGVCRPRRTAARGDPGCPRRGVHPGYALGRDYEGLDDALLVAVTEKRTPDEIDRLAEVLAACEADLREARARVAAPARCRATRTCRARRPRGAPPRVRRRACPSWPSPSSSATSRRSPTGTSGSTRASTRSAPAR